MPNNFISSNGNTFVGTQDWDKVVFQLDTSGDTIVDVSSKANALTISPGATLSAAYTKFGQKTIALANGVQKIITPTSPMFNLAAQDACIEGWFKYDDMTHQNTLWRFVGATGGNFNPYLMIFNDGRLYLRTIQTGGNIVPPTVHNMVTGQMYHIEVDKVGNTWYVFIDGVMLISAINSTVTNEDKAFACNENLSTTTVGNIYGVRVQIGAARHIANFTPPNAPHSIG